MEIYIIGYVQLTLHILDLPLFIANVKKYKLEITLVKNKMIQI
jgi:hypothetical protein